MVEVPWEHFSIGIDWEAPWLEPWRCPGEVLAQQAGQAGGLIAALNASEWAPVRFVPQSELPSGQAYESHIFATRSVPTREGLHDFFNALCWMRFPQTKLALNRLQAEAIESAGGVKATRGALRDALTLFDENVALFQAPEPLWQALMARDWARLCVTLRPLWSQAHLVLFGHALLEKLVKPYKSITSHVLVLPVPPDLCCSGPLERPMPACAGIAHPWDAWLGEHMNAAWLSAKPFTPLPVLGVPGWCAHNAEPGYYDDARVFRQARKP